MAAQFVLAGKQVVAVEIDAGRARRKLVVGKARPVQVIRFVGGIRGNGVDLAIDQIPDPVAGRQVAHLLRRDAHFLQEQRDFIGCGCHIGGRTDHHGRPHQPVHVGRTAMLAHQQHAGRMLEHHGQHHHGLARHAAEQQGTVTHAVVGLARQHGRLGKRHAAAFDQFDFQPRLAVITLLDGRVIAGKLELVREIELQGDRFQRAGGRGQAQQQNETAAESVECFHRHGRTPLETAELAGYDYCSRPLLPMDNYFTKNNNVDVFGKQSGVCLR